MDFKTQEKLRFCGENVSLSTIAQTLALFF